MIVLLVVVSYVVILLFTTGSPIVISTPGGIESGVLPSLLARLVVAENARFEIGVLVVRVWFVATAAAVARHNGVDAPIERQSTLPLRPDTDNAALGGRWGLREGCDFSM